MSTQKSTGILTAFFILNWNNNIAAAYAGKGEYDKALEAYQKALAIDVKVLGPDHPDIATTYNNIAGVYSSTSEYGKALGWYVCAFRILLARLGDDYPNTKTAYKNMLQTYNKSGKTEDFKEWLDGKLAESDPCKEKL